MELKKLITGTLNPSAAEQVKDKLAAPQHSLRYLRVAYKAKDNADGLLYLHHFGTGNQELIFDDEAAADKFAAGDNAKITHKQKISPQSMADMDRQAILRGRGKLKQGYKANRRDYDAKD